MNLDRRTQILTAGLSAAKSRMFSERYLKGEEYPRNFDTLYSWLEDKLFVLYSAIANRKAKSIRAAAGEIIITASEIAEYAGTLAAREEDA